MSPRFHTLWRELESHLPYSVFATASGIILAGILSYVATVASLAQAPEAAHEPPAAEAHEREHGPGASEHVPAAGSAVMQHASHVTFHVFHPVHMLFSAIATTAMFWRYERRFLKAIIVGLLGAAGVCSISDVFIPYLSGLLLGAHEMTFHWCLIQHPGLVVPFMLVGVFVGVIAAETVRQSTYFSHSAHVFVSSAASIFYLVSFGLTDWAERLGTVFLLMVVAVTLPCCFSDIVFPLLATAKGAVVRDEHTHS